MTVLAFLALLVSTTNAMKLQVQQHRNQSTPKAELQGKIGELDTNAELDQELDQDANSAWAAQDLAVDQKERAFEELILKSYTSSISAICTDDIQNHRMQHPECADPWYKTQMCENSYEIPKYRLGDTYYEDKTSSPGYMQFYFPHSVAAKYLKQKTEKKDIATLLKVIEAPEYAHYEKPPQDTAVVHLRLGDALIMQVARMLRGNEYYSSAAKRLKKQGIKSVVLVTGDHKYQQKAILNNNAPKHQTTKDAQHADDLSQMRTRHIERIFKKEGLAVTKRINYNADCDFIYMASARKFVIAGGTFSRLIGQVVKSRGGEIIGYNEIQITDVLSKQNKQKSKKAVQ